MFVIAGAFKPPTFFLIILYCTLNISVKPYYFNFNIGGKIALLILPSKDYTNTQQAQTLLYSLPYSCGLKL